MASARGALDRYFGITERGSTLSAEIKGGLITFLSMSYILAVNPLILSPAAEGYTFDELFTATALAACIACLLMGLYARFPVALAPGMGLNAFLSYTICQSMGFTYEQGLMVVFISGTMFFLVTVSGIRRGMVESIPKSLKIAIAAGIGFFIAIIDLYNTGIIVHGTSSALVPGDMSDPGVLLALFCIIVTVCLWYRRKWYAIILGIIATWAIGALLFRYGLESEIGTLPDAGLVTGISAPDFGLFAKVFTGFEMFPSSMWVAFIGALVSMFIVDMFDTTGTLISVSSMSGMSEGRDEFDTIDVAMRADAAASLSGAMVGTSTTTSYIESFTGIESGARTGILALVCGLLFAFAMVFSGLFASVTAACTAGALILVGLIMVRNIRDIEWKDPVLCFSSIITVFMMGLAGSITDGIGIGIMAYVIGYVAMRKEKEISPTMWVLFLIFTGYFVIHATIY
ncbi:Permease [Thermoplasmatales archaeon BRNA1]|nr:Permease [Thermoplasmatales archaeon BRNA1]